MQHCAQRCVQLESCIVCPPLRLLRALLRATTAEVELAPTSATSRATVSPCPSSATLRATMLRAMMHPHSFRAFISKSTL